MLPKKTENTEASSEEIYRQYRREQHRAWRDNNPEKVRAIRRRHYPPVSELTPEQLEKRRSDARECYRKNREYFRDYQRQWANDPPEKVAEREARRKRTPISELPPEKAAIRRAKAKAYYRRNKEKCRALVKACKDRFKDAVAKQKQLYAEVENGKINTSNAG